MMYCRSKEKINLREEGNHKLRNDHEREHFTDNSNLNIMKTFFARLMDE